MSPRDRLSREMKMVGSVEIWLVRHGRTEWNEEGRVQGQLDSKLMPRGIKQAQAFGKLLAKSGIEFDRIYSSDLGRALESAKLFAKELNFAEEIRTDERLRERTFGEFDGLLWKDFPENARKKVASLSEGPFPGNMEARINVKRRATQALQDVGKETKREVPGAARILVVSHGGVIKEVQEHVLGTGAKIPPAKNSTACVLCLLTNGTLMVESINNGHGFVDKTESFFGTPVKHEPPLPQLQVSTGGTPVSTTPDATPPPHVAKKPSFPLKSVMCFALGFATAEVLRRLAPTQQKS